MPETTPIWLEIVLDLAGGEVRVSARGGRSEQTEARPLGAGFDVSTLRRFAEAVQGAAMRGQPLGAEPIARAQALHEALFGGAIGQLRSELRGELRSRSPEAGGSPLLVRVMARDPELQALPWEAACEPGSALGFWGSTPDLLPVRGATSREPWQPREVRGAVRVLAIAPEGGPGPKVLQGALAGPIASGEIEWLEPIEGRAANETNLFNRLRREPMPHVLHVLGHGQVDAQGLPRLRLADRPDGEAFWLPVESLAQHLQAHARSVLRLVVLEACEGAAPSAFASAAETLVRAGADAVLAHLWPVRAEAARACSTQFYRALASASQGGDVARSLNDARRAMLASFEASAEAFSPVLYLRAPEAKLFDFGRRRLEPPRPSPPSPPGGADLAPALARLLRRPFSLVLGDRLKDERAALGSFRDRLHQGLARASDPAPSGLPMSALTQRYAFRQGAERLGTEFQKLFRADQGPPLVEALARVLGPGVHTTLSRNPWLEQSLAATQPGRTIQVIQPRDESVLVMRREANRDWQELDAPPAGLEPEHEALLLRPYRGYTPDQAFTRPLLTEDDYYQLGLHMLWANLPVDLTNAALSLLSYRPALIVGISLFTAHHRRLLHTLYERGLPRGSLVVLEPEDTERKLWEAGTGLPGKGSGVEVIEMPSESLCAALGAMPQGGGQ